MEEAEVVSIGKGGLEDVYGGQSMVTGPGQLRLPLNRPPLDGLVDADPRENQ